MELLAQIPIIGGALSYVVPFLVVLSIVVFVHEFGHYIVGRWAGIKAEVFSIGFGKVLWKWTDRRGTRWQVAVLPLGGFVRFVGDMDPASAGRGNDEKLTPEERKVAFHNAGLLRRTLTVAAGPFANFLLSVVIFTGIVLSVPQGSTDPVIGSADIEVAEGVGFEVGDRVLSISGKEVENFYEISKFLLHANGEPQSAVVERDGDVRQIIVRNYHSVALIKAVTPGMPAARAGMMPGDVFVSADGEPVTSYRGLQLITAEIPHGAEIEVVVEREGERLTFRFVPYLVMRQHLVKEEKVLLPTMGIQGSPLRGFGPELEMMPIYRAVPMGVSETWRIISVTMSYVGEMVFKGADTSQLGGPIRIAEISGDAAQKGFSNFVWLIAVLSTSIGLINLFPIPILDGGHLMFYLVEFVRGRPVGETWMRVGTKIGLSLVLLLMVFATYNDLVRL